MFFFYNFFGLECLRIDLRERKIQNFPGGMVVPMCIEFLDLWVTRSGNTELGYITANKTMKRPRPQSLHPSL